MFAVAVTFVIKPKQMDDFMPLMLANARKSQRSEPGCCQFDVCTDDSHPNTVFLYEVYKSGEAFQAHLDSRHFKEFDAQVSDMIAAKDVQSWNKVIQ
jgi:quinol monooxygenase YgiN